MTFYKEEKGPSGEVTTVRCSYSEFCSTRRWWKKDKVGDMHVSTVFMGIDHNCSGQGEPVLYETMVFECPDGDHQRRYCTREAAVAGHKEIVSEISARWLN